MIRVDTTDKLVIIEIGGKIGNPFFETASRSCVRLITSPKELTVVREALTGHG